MRKSILTISITSDAMPVKLRKAYEVSLKLKHDYANRIGADMIPITEKVFMKYGSPSIERLEMFNLFDRYDRILYADADVLIKPDAPDIFSVFDDDDLHMLSECKNNGSYYSNINYIENTVYPYMKSVKPDFNPPSGFPYFNAGVMLASKKHKEIFHYTDEEYFEGFRLEQDFINYNIFKMGITVKPLPIEWNAILLFLHHKNDYLEKHHFIHYITGTGNELDRAFLLDDAERLMK